MDSKVSYREKFGIASTQFGGMLGAGIASGATVSVYFINRNGYLAIIFPLLSLAFLFTLYYVGLETTRLYQLNSNSDLYNLLYGNNRLKKIMTPLANFTVFYMMVFSSVMAFSGVGTIFKNYFHLPSLLGGFIVAVSCILIIYFGLKVFQRLQSIICLIMFFIISISYVIALASNGIGLLGEKILLRWWPESASIGSSIWWALSFSAIYIGFLPLLIIAGKPLRTSNSIKSTLRIGFVLNSAAVYLPCLAILAFAPNSTSAGIPATYAVGQAGIPFAETIYLILLFLALVSTGASCLFTIGTQLSGYLPKLIKSEKFRNGIVYIIFSIFFILCATLGLTAALSVFAPMANILCILTLVIPLAFLAPGKIINMRKANKAQEEN
jgi:hypothetical protein